MNGYKRLTTNYQLVSHQSLTSSVFTLKSLQAVIKTSCKPRHTIQWEHSWNTHKSNSAPTQSSVDVNPCLGSLLHQTTAVQQGAKKSSNLLLCMGSPCKQESPFLNQTWEIWHQSDGNCILRQELGILKRKREHYSSLEHHTETNLIWKTITHELREITSSNVASVTPAATDTMMCLSVMCCEISLRTSGTRWGLTATKTTSDPQTTSMLEWVTGTPSSWKPIRGKLRACRDRKSVV